MPSRTYNILAAGKPILALTDEGSEVALTISEDDLGWAVQPEDPAKLAAAVKEIFENRDRLAEMGERSRALLRINTGWPKQLKNTVGSFSLNPRNSHLCSN